MLTKLLEILRTISEVIARNEDSHVVLSQIVDILADNLQVEVCSVYVYDEGNDELVLTATHGLNRESVGDVRMKPGDGLSGTSFQQRRIFNLSNPEQHPQFKYFKTTGEERYKSFLSVPLTVGGKCVGILVIQRVQEQRFDPSIIDMVKSLSTQLANLILNARMLKDLARDESGQPKPETPSIEQVMLRGIAANYGITKGRCFILESRESFQDITHDTHGNKDKEMKLFEDAIELTKKQTLELEKQALSMISEADASIFYVHLLFLEDRSLMDKIRNEIIENDHSVEFSIKLLYMEYLRRFSRLDDQVFRERVSDFKDMMLRLLESVKILRGAKTEIRKKLFDGEKLVLVAEELLPSDLIRLPVDRIAGIITEKGGVTAHVAVLAKALDFPALMGVKQLMKNIHDGDEVILDCHAELMYIRPGPSIISHFDELISTGQQIEAEPDSDPALTTDNHEIILRANISLICETSLLDKFGAQGIGLYRTEFLYMIRDYLPSEEDQYNVFSRIFKEANGDDITIRVLDAGADKPLPYINIPKEDNPALGFRGIRLLLARQDIFKTQLRAILRAGALGKLRLLFPMISTVEEMVQVRQVLAEVETELHEKNIEHTEEYKIGMMLEVPSAIFAVEKLLEDVDYISIGSNDLLQYTFASDRGNEMVAEYFDVLHPIFLGILKHIGDILAKHPDKSLALCGEMAGNVLAIPFIIGAGIHDLSMTPRLIPAVKKTVRQLNLAECRKMLEEAIKLNTPEAVKSMVKQTLTDKGINNFS